VRQPTRLPAYLPASHARLLHAFCTPACLPACIPYTPHTRLTHAFQGHGTLVGADGSRYEGLFRRGLISGQGTMRYPNGDEFAGLHTHTHTRRIHTSYTPLTRLLHASYTPLTRPLQATYRPNCDEFAGLDTHTIYLIYVYIHIHMHMYIYIYLCIYICMYMYMYVCMYVYTYVCVYIYMI
jgi:hypothetical protein